MTISYPLSLPSTPGIKDFRLMAITPTAITTSPFSGAAQVYLHPSSWWEAEVTLPPMSRADAEEWIGTLTALYGTYGTFLMGDPDGTTARGIATGTPLVNGASQIGTSLVSDGWTVSQTGILKRGDYIQIGQFMYKILNDANSDGSGNATFDVFPNLRGHANNAPIIVSSAKSRWRLVGNRFEWSTTDAQHYGITFLCREDVGAA